MYNIIALEGKSSSKKSKFSLKAPGAPPLYPQNDNSTEIINQKHSNIKDAYLQSAIEKYKSKRREEMLINRTSNTNHQRSIL